ncbi:hypothetical protein AB6A40_000311 [Gnathostoma spinigerum]|uniref:Flavin-containing monooxygenase n=1 Tax=Gnathostoma spinigerum TaxID=75299 RepID=A0ABD6E3Y2_9BILA
MRVCVIGAGVSGLPAIKECVAAGFDVVAYERTSEIGGLWNYRPEMKEISTVMGSTVVNTSKEMMAYSDFPPPKESPNFMHHSFVQKYNLAYAEKFGLRKYIQFNTTVEKVEQCGDQWEITLNGGEKKTFDYVLLCTGHHCIPLYPQVKDADKYKGRTLHAHDYRDYHGFENKNVFIIGIGNSALDIATELAKISKSVTISTRRGTWIWNRVSDGGMPYDILFFTRLYYFALRLVPWTLSNDYVEHRIQQRLDHDTYGLRPNHRFFQQHPAVNDSLPNLMCSGQIVVTEDVDSFYEDGIIVKGGRRFPADVVIYSTGYTFNFDFVYPKSAIPVKDNEVKLYKYVFPLDHPNLAVIGLIQPIGSIAPISEIQSRWVASVFTGRCKLPSRKTMLDDIEEKRAQMQRRYYKSVKHTVQVDYVLYMDEIAELIGCKPNLLKYLFTEPKFFFRLLVGANAPYVYRLCGPGKWEGAKEALESLPDRVKAPMKKRECRIRRYKKRGKLDEYFRYASMKWCVGWTFLLVIAGFWTFCSGPVGISPIAYFLYITTFMLLLAAMFIWFDYEFSMSTII